MLWLQFEDLFEPTAKFAKSVDLGLSFFLGFDDHLELGVFFVETHDGPFPVEKEVVFYQFDFGVQDDQAEGVAENVVAQEVNLVVVAEEDALFIRVVEIVSVNRDIVALIFCLL